MPAFDLNMIVRKCLNNAEAVARQVDSGMLDDAEGTEQIRQLLEDMRTDIIVTFFRGIFEGKESGHVTS